MGAALNGRVARLEATYAPPAGPDTCRGCGLRHVRPLTLALLRGALRIVGGSGLETERRVPLCLCSPCCTADRWLARRSHGLPDDEGAP